MVSTNAIRNFLAAESGLSKLWLGFAVASAAFVVYSWLPDRFLELWTLLPMHLGVMASGFALLVVMGRRNLGALFGKPVEVTRVPMPLLYWPCLVAAFVYFIVVFFGYGPKYPAGGPRAPAHVDLRIAGSVYLFMALAGFGLSHLVGKRVPKVARPNNSLERTREG
jgi:hypothetical protein